MPTTRTNAIDLLIDDHRRVETLFGEYENETLEISKRKRIVDEITRELSMHSAIEEQIFYPAVKQALNGVGVELVEEATQEHIEMKQTLAILEDMDQTSPEYDERVRALIRTVRHHVEEEEGEMFPKFRDAIDAKRLTDIGASLERAKKVAPTRPHPHAPTRPPANVVVGAAAGAVDRVRDAAEEMAPEQRSAVTTALKVVGVVGMAVGAAIGAVRFVQSRRKPPTRVEQLRGVAMNVGGKAMEIGGKARDLTGKITAENMQQVAGKAWMAGGKAKELTGKARTAGAGAVRSLRKRAS